MLSRKRSQQFLICTLEAHNLQWRGNSVYSASHLTASFFGRGTSRTSQKKLGKDLEHCGRLLINWILQEEQLSTKTEYACLSWMSASPTVLNQHSIQQKALRIIGVDQVTACRELGLQHRREVAAVTVLYKMHTSHCPRDLQALLPNPYTSRRTTRASSSMPDHAVAMPHAKTSTLDRIICD